MKPIARSAIILCMIKNKNAANYNLIVLQTT